MGSVCAMMFADMYSYEVNGLVLDSPFRYLGNIVERIAEKKNAIAFVHLKTVFVFNRAKSKQISRIRYFLYRLYINSQKTQRQFTYPIYLQQL